jgi:FtsH-binding integral membrane protein
MSNLVHNFNSEYNTNQTVIAQNDYAIKMRTSSMYEFIFLFLIALIVLVITIRNLTSETTTPAGYMVCCIILVIFFVALIAYITNRIQGLSHPWESGVGSGLGPVIRIHYV